MKYRKKIEEEIKLARGVNADDFSLAIETNYALDKQFLFHVLAKLLCAES